ncbi:Phytochrome-like protein cph2 [Marinomonas aquimarina]|uniref:cyclic-guanylate-specific phosphodiesterase n=1 Tax=Marinomonas aquimarina TaxID=295068 RepID=A0A1A8T8W6_9GAMM|nr:EAL domain-containing protein [Marinomonas aquimarina]SBS29132.1 Phytochrome-like protein cph2 [Marinomonas aquimarina]
MAKPCKPQDAQSRLEQIIGLGERSVRKNYYPQLRENAEQVKRFRALLDFASDWIILLSLQPFQICDVNAVVCQFFSLTAKDISNGRHRDLMRQDPESSFCELMHHLKQLTKHHDDNEGISSEFWIEHKGTQICLELTCRLAKFEGQSFITVVGRDMTERKQHQQSLQRLLNEKEALLDNALVGLAWIKNRTIQTCNRKFEQMLGCEPGQVNGRSTHDFYENAYAYQAFGDEAYKELANGHKFTGRVKMIRQDGAAIWCELTGNAINPNAPDEGSVWIFSDVHEHMLNQEKAEFLALHDPLTELPNHNKLQQEFIRYSNDLANNHMMAIVSLDLDRFKNVNDLLGYTESNQLLVRIGQRLQQYIGRAGIVSRQGGDEFTVLLPSLSSAESCLPLLNRIHAALMKPFFAAQQELSLTCSMGVAIYPQDGEDFDNLLKRSGMALFEAKASGRNTYRYFNEAMNEAANETLVIELGLSKALELQQFELHYQPQIDLKTGKLIGAESLIRWRHPELGLISPSQFIPVAEEVGMIVAIGKWVLEEACRQVKIWHEMGFSDSVIGVNLSAVQFTSGNIEQTVRDALKQAGVSAKMIELELTESIILKDADNVLEKVHNLKQMGCRLSIDDFGTGYSSLAYLKRFAVNKLKIDQAFIKDMQHNQDDDVIVRTIIQMAHNLGLKTIAEGIEDPATLELLRSYHCDEAQGYFIARPMDQAAFYEYLSALE